MLFGGLGAAGLPASAQHQFNWDETHYSDVHTSASIYGDTIWHLTPQTNATVGLRYTRDHKEHDLVRAGPRVAAAGRLPQCFGPLAGLNAAAFPSNVIFATAAQLAATPVSAARTGPTSAPAWYSTTNSTRTPCCSPRSRGYQAGGFNIFTPPIPPPAPRRAKTQASSRRK
jgi:iron complex outermembrane receptor protein